MLSVCSGAFTLAQAGILDGRKSTTDWMHTDKLSAMYPKTEVGPDVLFVEDRKVVTSAGTGGGEATARAHQRQEHPRAPVGGDWYARGGPCGRWAATRLQTQNAPLDAGRFSSVAEAVLEPATSRL
ncbi:DJ-1/PfpI family protein [Schumannella luteola]